MACKTYSINLYAFLLLTCLSEFIEPVKDPKRVMKNFSFLVVVVQLCLTVYDPMDCSVPGFPVLHYLLEFAQTHVH